MTRIDKIDKIRTFAPKILNLTLCEIGYEFDAIHEDGFIVGYPGMLLGLRSKNLTKNKISKPTKLLEELINWDANILVSYDSISDEMLNDIFNLCLELE